jgi:hypothetical protein
MSDVNQLIAVNEEERGACRAKVRSVWVQLMAALDGAGQGDQDLADLDLARAAALLETLKQLRQQMRGLLEDRQALLMRATT